MPHTQLTMNNEQLVTDADILHESMLRSATFKMSATGEVVMPCVPSMLDYYISWLDNLFTMLGKPMPEQVKDSLYKLLENHLEVGFKAERHSELVFRYEPSEKSTFGISCSIGTRVLSIADEYSKWVETREPPLFGAHPDAKVMIVASELGEPAQSRILDVGAGVGRNTMPLAKLGYPVDALEVTPAFAEQIRATAAAEGLPVSVIESDVFSPEVQIEGSYQLAIAAEVTSDFRGVEQLQTFLKKMSDLLNPGGSLLFNIFLAADDYEPDQMARELSQVMISSVFTSGELALAMTGLPLELISNESVCEYEQKHLPAEAWPPISWFVNWASGRNVFPLSKEENPPIELRWILCHKKA
jgi:SAM-dependent methyltransferase